MEKFNLTQGQETFEFIFGLYNFISGAKSQNDLIGDSAAKLQNVRLEADEQTDLHLPDFATNREDPQDGYDNVADSHPPMSFDDASVQANLANAGYKLYNAYSGFEPLVAVSKNCRRGQKHFS
jgi:hypothetical protein